MPPPIPIEPVPCLSDNYAWLLRAPDGSLAIVNDDVQIGDQLTLIWGEPETTGKTSTEPHRQAEIRVRVSPTPYAREARENYADSWRTKK